MNPSFFKLKWNFVVGIISAMFIALLLPLAAWAQPSNDESSGAVSVTPSLDCNSTQGSTIDATPSDVIRGDCSGFFSDFDVWYSFVATATNHNIFVGGDADFDPAIDVRNSFGFIIDCTDETGLGDSEVVALGGLTVGQEYLVRVWSAGWLDPGGTFDICMSMPDDDLCNPIADISCGESILQGLGIFGIWDETGCSSPATGEEQLCRFTPNTTGAHSLQVLGISGTVQYMYKEASDGCTASGWTCIAQASAAGAFPIGTLTAGTQYYLRADLESSEDVYILHQFRINCPGPPPPNDDCSGAIALTPGTSCDPMWYSPVNATESLPATCNGTADDDLWFSFEATVSNHAVRVRGDGFDPVVDVRSGTCNGTSIACVDETNTGEIEYVTLNGLTVGTTYHVRVYSRGAATINHGIYFSICVLELENDPCASITPLSCGTGEVVSLSGSGEWNMEGSPPNNSCGSATLGREHLYSFTPTVTGTHTLELAISSGDHINYFYKAASDGCGPTGWTCIGDLVNEDDVAIIGTLTAGVQYYILADVEEIAFTTQYFKINCPPPPPNDDCSGAYTLAAPIRTYCGGGIWYNSEDATQSLPAAACGGTADDDVWFKFVASVAGHTVHVESNSDFNAVVDVRSGDCDGTSIVCANATGDGGEETVELNGLTVGATYYVRVYGFGPDVDDLIDFSICVYTQNAACLSISDLTCGTPATHTLSNYGQWHDTSPCGNNYTPGQEKIYSFTPTTTGAYYLQVIHDIERQNDGIDYSYKAASAGCSAAGWTCIGSFTGPGTEVIGMLTAGTEYYILADAETHDPTTQTIEIACYDPCTDISTLTCGTPTTHSTSGSSAWNLVNYCGAYTLGKEKVYSFTATSTGMYALQVISENGSGSGYMSYGYKAASLGCSATGLIWHCIEGGVISPGTFTFGPLTAGTEYYILADGEDFGTNYTQTFQINCPVAPVSLTCPNSFTSAACGTQAQIDTVFSVWLSLVSGTGGCNGVLTNNNTGAPPACGGTTTVTFTYTSECAPFTTTCQATFTVTPAPQAFLNCPQNRTVAACPTQQEFSGIFTTWLQTASAGGGCHGAIDFELSDGLPYCGGATTLTLIYTSSCSPTLTCEAIITVEEPTVPVVVNCPNDTTVAACGFASFFSDYSAWTSRASASGGCGGGLVMPSSLGFDFSLLCGGSNTVTFSYFKPGCPALSPPVTCQATFTVEEAPPVVLTCPQNTTTEACQTQAAVDTAFTAWLETASGSGSCFGVLSNNSEALGGAPPACGGSVTVTFSYVSFCESDTATCEATFTVPAVPNVALTCPVNTTAAACQTQVAINAQFAAWIATASASGGCNGALSNNNLGAPSACGGSTTVTFTYTSSCDPTTTTCEATFTVSAAPTVALTCPQNTTTAACQTQAAVDVAFATWLATASTSGGCNGVLTNNNTGAPLACGGSTTVTFTYTSSCAPLTTTCQATFTVPVPPTVTLTCPVNTTVSACLTQTAVDAQYAAWLATASASGGCNGVLTNNSPGAPSICVAAGTVRTVTFTYTSTCAPFMTSCTATFTVPVYPDFTVPANGAATVACPANATQPTPPVVTDACGKTLTPAAPVVTNAPNPLTCEGTRTYTWTYTDCAGHVKTWSHIYTIEREPFTVPANGTATVACPANATQPTPPTVMSNCGEVLVPVGPTVTNVPNPITCEGTRTYAWAYTDCEGNTASWSFIYTIEREPFNIATPNGSATVDCPDDTDVVPVPPVVTSNCGEVLIPVLFSVSPKNDCGGHRAYTFRYTDCEGNFADWVFLYNGEYPDFTVPPSEVSSVECPSLAIAPAPPTVIDACGRTLVPVGPITTDTPNPNGCMGSRSYSWTYTDCEGNEHSWSKTYHFLYTADFFAPLDEENFVTCLAYAVAPVPQVLYDACGEEISVSDPVITEEIATSGCTGWRRYSFVYTDCVGHSHPWSFTYYINDNEGPLGTCPGGGVNGAVSVNVANLNCIEEVPCPDDYDFTDKVQDLIENGNYYDVCGGGDIKITLDSWSDLWECSDPDGNGVNTFGRTFYFRITDACGNEAASRCEVTYSGTCQPLRIFSQEAWGIAGGAPGSSVSGLPTDLQVINTLISTNNPVVVGGTARSLTIDDAQCVVNLLPGTSGPAVLANCHQVNCTAGSTGVNCNPMGIGGMKNSLAANAIALELNIRYNMEYIGLTRDGIRSQRLDCLDLDPAGDITNCDGPGGCKLHLWVGSTLHEFPYTLGGLQDLSNLYLGGGFSFSTGFNVLYAKAINQALATVNGHWGSGVAQVECGPADSAVPSGGGSGSKALPTGRPDVAIGFGLAPNPAGREVTLTLDGMDEAANTSFELYNQFGQLLLRKEFRTVASIHETVDISDIRTGLYIASLKIGDRHFEQKLVVQKD